MRLVGTSTINGSSRGHGAPEALGRRRRGRRRVCSPFRQHVSSGAATQEHDRRGDENASHGREHETVVIGRDSAEWAPKDVACHDRSHVTKARWAASRDRHGQVYRVPRQPPWSDVTKGA